MRIVAVPFSLFVKDTVTITRPMPSVYMRGLAAAMPGGPHMTFRMKTDESVTVTEAAQALDMSRSSFIRWCAYNVAVDIMNQKNEYDKRK